MRLERARHLVDVAARADEKERGRPGQELADLLAASPASGFVAKSELSASAIREALGREGRDRQDS